jgi:hypothetical protein
MSALNLLEMSNALWFFARLGLSPPEPWLQQYWSTLQPVLVNIDAQGLASVLWSAAVLQLKVPKPVMDGMVLEVQVRPGSRVYRSWGSC